METSPPALVPAAVPFPAETLSTPPVVFAERSIVRSIVTSLRLVTVTLPLPVILPPTMPESVIASDRLTVKEPPLLSATEVEPATDPVVAPLPICSKPPLTVVVPV